MRLLVRCCLRESTTLPSLERAAPSLVSAITQPEQARGLSGLALAISAACIWIHPAAARCSIDWFARLECSESRHSSGAFNALAAAAMATLRGSNRADEGDREARSSSNWLASSIPRSQRRMGSNASDSRSWTTRTRHPKHPRDRSMRLEATAPHGGGAEAEPVAWATANHRKEGRADTSDHRP